MKLFSKIACLSVLLALSACEGTKKELGLTRTAPDEFAVVKRAPLEMPPDYTLRPPQPGAPRPQEAEPGKQAQSVMFGSELSTSQDAPDEGEAVLLQQAGAGVAQPGIRDQVDRETAVLEPKDKPVAEKLMGWSTGGNDTPPATVVDAEAEADRLRKNIEEGKPVTEGETPTIED